MKVNKEAMNFAVGDTLIALPINIVLNFILLSIFMGLGWGPATISVVMTGIFFVAGILRKYIVRRWFDKHAFESVPVRKPEPWHNRP
jgi:Na+-driven multidrug efflux pump|tara:strand:- start:135 stop:395 length:261 start_codon:yes stop_codon:yes gene_type:complete